MTYKHVVLTVSGAIGTLTLNRPEKLNAFIDTMREEIAQGLEELGKNPNLQTILPRTNIKTDSQVHERLCSHLNGIVTPRPRNPPKSSGSSNP